MSWPRTQRHTKGNNNSSSKNTMHSCRFCCLSLRSLLASSARIALKDSENNDNEQGVRGTICQMVISETVRCRSGLAAFCVASTLHFKGPSLKLQLLQVGLGKRVLVKIRTRQSCQPVSRELSRLSIKQCLMVLISFLFADQDIYQMQSNWISVHYISRNTFLSLSLVKVQGIIISRKEQKSRVK